jgi:hypothetical protein
MYNLYFHYLWYLVVYKYRSPCRLMILRKQLKTFWPRPQPVVLLVVFMFIKRRNLTSQSQRVLIKATDLSHPAGGSHPDDLQLVVLKVYQIKSLPRLAHDTRSVTSFIPQANWLHLKTIPLLNVMCVRSHLCTLKCSKHRSTMACTPRMHWTRIPM